MKKSFFSGSTGGEDGNKTKLRLWRWMAAVASVLVILGVAAVSISGQLSQADAAAQKHHKTPTPAPGKTPTQSGGSTSGKVTVWIQVTDSCKQALSGATFTVAGPGVNLTTAPTNGSRPQQVPNPTAGCPTNHGSCANFSTGCTSVALNIPSSGTNTYTITVAKTAPGQGSNLSYAICQGGSDCPHGPEVATVKISSSGSVSATTHNFYPDGAEITWGPWNGNASNPILFHEFGIGNGSIQCDGDHDADDYLTGTPGGHCDSDSDKSSPHH